MLHLSLLLAVLHIIHGHENIVLNKPTHQSNAYMSAVYAPATFDSSNAVDGLKTNLSALRGQCAILGDGQKSAIRWVNLTSVHSIHDIRIYYRTDNVPWGHSNGHTARILGFYVYVSNTTDRQDDYLCFHDTNYTRADIPAVIDILCPVHGQFVIYYNERPQNSSYHTQYSQDAHADLCEVEVNGCKKTGYYGSNCSLPCPDTNCRYCHIETGACQGCKPGYQGHQCKIQCDNRSYGYYCLENCGACLVLSNVIISMGHVLGVVTLGMKGNSVQLKEDQRETYETEVQRKQFDQSRRTGPIQHFAESNDSDNKYHELGELSLPSDYEGLR
ncbi:uncharacterized protein LOC133203133 [Saccostrea echinata]|uniref:uncharacterized protein LOC133203133 n=1 Tax=Saccostrea echinata TaxID=191078 RepID=UPI002A7EBFBC|nr:uncharacterized protein LOC133203133 [Saccostrea echinata]